MSKPRCLVIGGAGFIGINLVDALLRESYSVRVFDRLDPAAVQAVRPQGNIEYMRGNFENIADVRSAVAGCDICFHLVSTTLPKTSNENPVFDVASNLIASVQFFQEAASAGVARVIFLSSGGTVYGPPRYLPIDELHPTDPTNSYGIVKLSIEKYLALFKASLGLDYIILRLSNPFGEHQQISGTQGAIAVFMGRALQGQSVDIWGDGSVVRDYIYIQDVVDAMLLAIEYSGSHRLFNVGSGAPKSLKNVIDAIEEVTGLHVKKNYMEPRSFDVPASVLSIDRAREFLGWQPRTEFLEALARTRDWITTQLHT